MMISTLWSEPSAPAHTASAIASISLNEGQGRPFIDIAVKRFSYLESPFLICSPAEGISTDVSSFILETGMLFIGKLPKVYSMVLPDTSMLKLPAPITVARIVSSAVSDILSVSKGEAATA